MKKIILLFFALISLSVNAQVYSRKVVMDKFNDVILEKNIKTLVIKKDSCYIIEEKGSKPVTYNIIGRDEEETKGSDENIVRLFDDVYGYQEQNHVVPDNEYDKYLSLVTLYRTEQDEKRKEEILFNIFEKYIYVIIQRNISDQYTHKLIQEDFCICKSEGYGKTLYINR